MTGEGEPAGAPAPTGAGSLRTLERLWWTPLVLAAVPLAIGLAILAQHTWYPIGDFGQANMRLLSFWSDPPLVGAAGRIVGPDGQQGNHPGPSIFWMAWPVWWLLGGSSWAVNASVAVTNLVGAALAVGCALRLGGRWVAAGVGAVVVLLVAGYGPEVMLMPWNPSMPLMWFLALLVATWGVLLGHRGMLLVVAATASHVVQAHAGYAPLALVLCALAGLAVLRDAWRTRTEGGIRSLLPWLGGTVALAALIWVPPLVDQMVHDPGNVTILQYSFGHPDEDYVGLARALQLVVLQLDPTAGLLRGAELSSGVPVGGILLLGAWVGSGIWARRSLGSTWKALDVVLALVLVTAWVAISRIFGFPFVYLFKWMWAICGLVVLATGGHVLAALRARGTPAPRRIVAVGVAVALVAGLTSGVLRYSRAEVSGEPYSDTIAGLIEPTADALDPDAVHMVRWEDPVALGGVGFGMVLELERRGFDVGVDERFSAAGEPHRVLDDDQADDVVWVVSGEEAIEATKAKPGAEVLAEADARTPAERVRYDELEERVATGLEDLGLDEDAERVRTGGNLFAVLLSNPDLPDDIVDDIGEMIDLFVPTAVILTPPEP